MDKENRMKRNVHANLWIALVSVFCLLIVGAACTITHKDGKGTGPPMLQTAGPPAIKTGGPPAHAPAHGYRAKYTYYYYPGPQVYFDVGRSVYFYMDSGNWRMSVSLPTNLRVTLGDHVTIDMDTDKPYTQFAEHKKKYPPGQLKKKEKWS